MSYLLSLERWVARVVAPIFLRTQFVSLVPLPGVTPRQDQPGIKGHDRNHSSQRMFHRRQLVIYSVMFSQQTASLTSLLLCSLEIQIWFRKPRETKGKGWFPWTTHWELDRGYRGKYCLGGLLTEEALTSFYCCCLPDSEPESPEHHSNFTFNIEKVLKKNLNTSEHMSHLSRADAKN